MFRQTPSVFEMAVVAVRSSRRQFLKVAEKKEQVSLAVVGEMVGRCAVKVRRKPWQTRMVAEDFTHRDSTDLRVCKSDVELIGRQHRAQRRIFSQDPLLHESVEGDRGQHFRIARDFEQSVQPKLCAWP